MAWQPQEGPILELAGYLKDSLGNPYNANAHKRATEVCLISSYGSIRAPKDAPASLLNMFVLTISTVDASASQPIPGYQ